MNRHQIKCIFLIHNLINGINKRGFASRATYIYWRGMDRTIRYSKKFKYDSSVYQTILYQNYNIGVN